MKTLLILRHAKSSWKDESLSDHERPLNKRGKRDAPKMGRFLAENGLQPDLILSSTAVRARTTAEFVVAGGELTCPVELVDELYLAPPAAYVDTFREQRDHYHRILVIGHNPGLEDLVERLTGGYEKLPTAALVQVDFAIDSWQDLPAEPRGKLEGIWRPRELD